MLHDIRRLGAPAMAGAVMAVVLTACGSGSVAQVTTPARPSTTAGTIAAAAAGPARTYQLYTHCGIDEARIGNRYFEAVKPLSDGQGNPPPGWGNPYQPGTMTLLSPAEAVFRDHAGHQVQFRLRPGATGFKHLCS
ncbi:MAG TPA: hypothetical protein VII22_29975 [Streptosporangiaceae bacterium]